MGGNRSVENCLNLKILVGFIFVFAIRFSYGATNPNDVAALNSLYVALESPALPGWVASGGDPCGGAWQGVQCDGGTTISSITLTGANLNGELGDSLGTFSSIKSIELSNNLIRGSIPSELPATLQNFFLSDNKFTGSIPSSLSSISQLSALSLNNNKLTGEIPDSFEGLTALVNLDFSSNNLSGQLPPSLRNLSSLTTLHLQNNQLSGALDVLQDLPLRDLNIENNLFSGPIPAKLLSIPTFRQAGNPFNTSIAPLPPPAATGTPPPAPPFFLGPSSEQTPPTSGSRPGKQADHGKQADGPSATKESNSVKSIRSSRVKRIVWISIGAVLLFIVLVLAIMLFVPRCLEKRRETYRTPKQHEIAPFTSTRENHRDGGSLVQPSNDKEKAPIVAVARPNEENQQREVGSVAKPWSEHGVNNKKMSRVPKPNHLEIDTAPIVAVARPNEENQQREVGSVPKPWSEHGVNNKKMSRVPKPNHHEIDTAPIVAVVRPNEEKQQREVGSVPKPWSEHGVNNKKMSGAPKPNHHEIDMNRFETDLMPPPPPPPPPFTPPPFLLQEKVIVKPIAAAEANATNSLTRHLPATSVKAYTIASLQQYTNSFSEENLIGGGMLGNVYRAQLPDRKLLAVKKLDKKVANQQKDDQFLEMVNCLDKIRHANVVELMGYCAEHDQRLLIYEYCSNGTLLDALNSDDEFKKNLSWNTRISMALGAARALEYLHEVCEPPIIHRNFKSANVLLDDELAIRVSDCGLAPLIASGAASQLSGLLTIYGYGAPEFESGIYTSKSDVYSFGVVMLELLTGRMSYDRTRIRGEQFLVRWAIPQLHDIDSLSRMVDPALEGKYPVKSVSHFADIISRCVQTEPEFRPLMSEVVQDLIEMIRRESPKRSGE